MEHYVIIVNDWKPLTIITKSSILDVSAVLDPASENKSQIRVTTVQKHTICLAVVPRRVHF